MKHVSIFLGAILVVTFAALRCLINRRVITIRTKRQAFKYCVAETASNRSNEKNLNQNFNVAKITGVITKSTVA